MGLVNLTSASGNSLSMQNFKQDLVNGNQPVNNSIAI